MVVGTLKISLDRLQHTHKKEFSRVLSCREAVSIVSDACLWKQVCVWKQQKGHSGRECIRWIDPGLAAVCQA